MWYFILALLAACAFIIPLAILEIIFKVLAYLQWDKEQNEKVIDK